jgi:hypothetical protein
MDPSNILRLSIAIIAGYATLFILIWIFRARKNQEKK